MPALQIGQEQEAMPDAAPLALKDTAAGAYLETLKASQCSTIQKGIEALCFQLRVLGQGAVRSLPGAFQPYPGLAEQSPQIFTAGCSAVRSVILNI